MILTLHKGVDPMYWRIALLILLTRSYHKPRPSRPTSKHYVCSITTVSSPACRVRAHRSGKLKELRELAAEFDVTPVSLQHAEAMDLQSK